MSVKNFDSNVLCKIDQFRDFSKINGLSLLDGTYLERLIVSSSNHKTQFPQSRKFLSRISDTIK
jgi:hypothetical protein